MVSQSFFDAVESSIVIPAQKSWLSLEVTLSAERYCWSVRRLFGHPNTAETPGTDGLWTLEGAVGRSLRGNRAAQVGQAATSSRYR